MLKTSPVNHQTQGRQAPSGLNWWVFLWASVVFIIYGSVFPFDFLSEAKPITEFYSNWNMFRNIPDASDNFLLFIPLGIGLDACFQGGHKRFLAGLVAWLLLGVGIQLVQLYLPTRTAAVSDALWNAVGMLFGILAFKRVRLVIDHLQRVSSSQQDSYAMLLVAIWFCYESFPFVPTLDVGELRAHIKSVVIAPPFELMRLFQHTLAAMLAGVAMLRANWMQPRWINVLIPGALAVFLEIFVAYGSLRRETLLGIIGGLLAGYWMVARLPKKIPVIAIGISLTALLLTVFTPYRGQAQGSTFTFTPFADIFWKGVTVDVSPSAFEALAIGAILWSGISLKATARIPRTGSISAVFALLLVLEVFRMYVVGYRGDTTPLALPRYQRHSTAPAKCKRNGPYQAHLFTVAALTGAIAVLFQLPGLPYNVRALVGSGIGGLVSALAVAVTAYGMANGAFLAIGLERYKKAMLLPTIVVAHGVVTWWVLRYSVPTKSLFDIVGTPSQGWPG